LIQIKVEPSRPAYIPPTGAADRGQRGEAAGVGAPLNRMTPTTITVNIAKLPVTAGR